MSIYHLEKKVDSYVANIHVNIYFMSRKACQVQVFWAEDCPVAKWLKTPLHSFRLILYQFLVKIKHVTNICLDQMKQNILFLSTHFTG